MPKNIHIAWHMMKKLKNMYIGMVKTMQLHTTRHSALFYICLCNDISQHKIIGYRCFKMLFSGILLVYFNGIFNRQ